MKYCIEIKTQQKKLTAQWTKLNDKLVGRMIGLRNSPRKRQKGQRYSKRKKYE